MRARSSKLEIERLTIDPRRIRAICGGEWFIRNACWDCPIGRLLNVDTVCRTVKLFDELEQGQWTAFRDFMKIPANLRWHGSPYI